MNARQDAAWKNLSFYRGYLPPADRERVKEYVLLALGDDGPTTSQSGLRREGSADPSSPPPLSISRSADYTPLQDILRNDSSVAVGVASRTDVGVIGGDIPPSVPSPLTGFSSSPQKGPHTVHTGTSPLTAPSVVVMENNLATTNRRSDAKRLFMIKKSALSQAPHFKSFLFKVKKCLDICPNLACTPDCPNVHVDLANPDLLELTGFEGMDSIIVNRGNLLPSVPVKVGDMYKTAGALFCYGLVHNGITQAVQGTQCRFGDRCRYGNRCLFIHMKMHAAEEPPCIVDVTNADTPIGTAVPFLGNHQPQFIEKLKEIGLETVADVQILSNTAFDSYVNRSPPEDQLLWMQVHTVRELKERSTPLTFALTTFPGVSEEKVMELLLNYRLESIDQLLELKPKTFYGMKVPPKILDAMERIRQRYEPDREAYRTIDLAKLPSTNFFKKVSNIALEFRESHAHKSWRKQDATRPIVTSLITYVEHATCFCQVHGNISAAQTPSLGPMGRSSSLSSPQRQGSSSVVGGHVDAIGQPFLYPENSWCRCPRKWELAVNYELSTPSGSRCSEQNCLGKLASMGLATCNIREIFVHGDMHNNEDPNPLFPCGVCENMLRRITHDVQKEYGGDVTLYMFDQVRDPKKLVCIPVQEISHREGSNFKRFIQEDLRGEDGEKFSNSLS